MRPAARAGAAIEILDRILAGEPAEKALIQWGRNSRYAGSGDRAAVRDLVYEALRARSTFAALGGSLTGRGLILGGMRAAGLNVDDWFDGSPHAPEPVREDEQAVEAQGADRFDIPEWLEAPLRDGLGDDFEPVMQAMRSRAPVILRANLARTTPEAAIAALAEHGIIAKPHPLASAALEVTEGARKIQASAPYLEGLVELQDAASQAVVEALPLHDGLKVLDLCAGGGGKTLAMAASSRLKVFAYDAMPRRLQDLEARAKRAGVRVHLCTEPEVEAPFDWVLSDVPCSGSGSWRRDPEGKWTLTPERLKDLTKLQAEILDRADTLVNKGGKLAYVTCSFLKEENEGQIEAFVARHPNWQVKLQKRFSPLQGGDGFYVAILTKG